MSFVFTSWLYIRPCGTGGKCPGLKSLSVAENMAAVQEAGRVPGTIVVVILNFQKICAQWAAEESAEIGFALAYT